MNKLNEIDTLTLNSLVLEEEKLKTQAENVQLKLVFLDQKKKGLYSKLGLETGDELRLTKDGWIIVKGKKEDENSGTEGKSVSPSPSKSSSEA